MTTVLLTAIGGDISQSAATILREAFPQWSLVGTDMNLRHAGALFVDAFHQAPSARDKTYRRWLEELVEKEGVDFCWPLSEPEIGLLCEIAQASTLAGKLVLPGSRVVEAGNDKLKTSQVLADFEIPGPWTMDAAEELSDAHFPCVYKPRSGAGSKAVFICKSLQEARFFLSQFPGGIFQELLLPAEHEVTCAVYRTRDGRVAVLPLLRVLMGGLTGWAEVIEDDEISRQCTTLAEGLDLHGSMNVQLRMTDNGPRIFEINARLSSTALIRHRMGFCDAVWAMREMLGERVELFAPRQGTRGVRIQDAKLLQE